MDIRDGGQIGTTHLGRGRVGDIALQVRDRITLDTDPTLDNLDRPSRILSEIRDGNSRSSSQITPQTRRLELLNGSTIQSLSSGTGRGAKITVNASERIRLAGTYRSSDATLDNPTGTTGAGISTIGSASESTAGQSNTSLRSKIGDIAIATPVLQIFDGANISSRATA